MAVRIKFYDQADAVVEKGKTWRVNERGDLSIYSSENAASTLFAAAAGGWKSAELIESQVA